MEVPCFKLKRNKRYLHFIQGIFKMVFVTQVEKKLGCGFIVQQIYKWYIAETWYSCSIHVTS